MPLQHLDWQKLWRDKIGSDVLEPWMPLIFELRKEE